MRYAAFTAVSVRLVCPPRGRGTELGAVEKEIAFPLGK